MTARRTGFTTENRGDDIVPISEIISAAGAINLLSGGYVAFDSTAGAMAVTLAAPADEGALLVLEHTVDGGDVTLALTNVEGGTAATTATFADVGDKLVLVAGATKWCVLKEQGVALA